MSEILPFNEDYKNKWDDYVKKSPSGTFYHLSGWKDVIEKTFGFSPKYLMALSEPGEIEGILPLFMMKDIFGRKYLISNPSSNYTGVCADDIDIMIALLNKAKEIAVENNVQYLEIRQLAKAVYDLPTKKDFVTMFLKLKNDEALVWKDSLTSKARNQVRKAYKKGLTVDFGKKYLDDFYRILSTNFRELGTPIYPLKFFSNILKEFGNSTNLVTVKYQDKVIGGMLFISYKRVFSDPWASSLRKYNKLCPNNILYWEAIRYACRNNFEYFDMGRSTVNSGTFNFKKQWGAGPIQLSYQYFLNKMQKIPEINAYGGKYQAAINLWKKLPLSVTNTIGPKIVRYLPEL